jgi:hypothetical protein
MFHIEADRSDSCGCLGRFDAENARSWAGSWPASRIATSRLRLFISPKTVSVHVSALLRKFGVSGREI